MCFWVVVMRVFSSTPPVILSFTHHSPAGLSGVQVDIETAASLGCHAATVVCAIASDEILPIEPGQIRQQANQILEQLPVQAIRISYLGSVENVHAVHSILQNYPDIPIVVDPVSHINGVEYDNPDETIEAMESLIMPLATVATPGIKELRRMGKSSDSLRAYAQEILDGGCEYLLVRYAKEEDGKRENHLYDLHGLKRTFAWDGLGNTQNGDGVTLSSSLTCYLSHGFCITESVDQAQKFTWQAVVNSRQILEGQDTANRFFWADKNKAAEAH